MSTGTGCPHAHDDAAYVLGALSPAERLEFERHLAGCDACTRSVRELAGLPGLLGRIDRSVLESPPEREPVPETVLPALFREVRRARRRRTAAVAVLAAAAVAVIAAVGVAVVGGDAGSHTTAPPVTSSSAVTEETMRPLGDVPVRARLTLEQVAWGTKLGLACTYDPASVRYEVPPETEYLLVVHTRDGATEQVGSWRSVDGRTATLWAATSTDREEIASVEVRTPDGRVVLRADT